MLPLMASCRKITPQFPSTQKQAVDRYKNVITSAIEQ